MRVVIEGDHLDAVPLGELAQVAEAVGVDGVDQDEAADGVVVHVGRVDDRDQVGVQRLELAHVAVDRAAQADGRLGIELVRGHHRRESVEVGVGVRGDEFGAAHG